MRPIDPKQGEWLLKHNHLLPKKRYSNYDEARMYLGIQVGRYCAFCEMQMSVIIDFKVEHALPYKNDLSSNDANELLLVCPFCSKFRHLFLHPNTAILTDLILPNHDDSFKFFTYEFSSKHLQKDLIDEGLLQLLPDSPHTSATLHKSYKQAWVLPNPKYKNQVDVYEKIKHTIRVLGLNYYVPAPLRGNDADPRIENRTQAWIYATETADSLIQQYVNISPERLAIERQRKFCQVLEKQAGLLAQLTGFWSVWMTVFLQKNFKHEMLSNQLICDLLIKNFPGTRYTLSNFDCQQTQNAE